MIWSKDRLIPRFRTCRWKRQSSPQCGSAATRGVCTVGWGGLDACGTPCTAGVCGRGSCRFHDLQQARHAAETLGLSCTYVTIKPAEIAAALPIVVKAIPVKDPVNTSIALTQYFVARFAGEQGYQRIITGQGADELLGVLAVPGDTDACSGSRAGFYRARTAG